jgi:6-pyruvoyltetrahydropterin/6-carboxytetrahydropterin synthase
MDCFELKIQLEFCAAHIIVGHKGKCANLHGHNYKVEVGVSGSQLDSLGLLIDFSDLKKEVKEVINKLDHKYLNEIDYPPFIEGKTSAENLSKYIYEELEQTIGDNLLDYVKIWETSKYSVKYYKKK